MSTVTLSPKIVQQLEQMAVEQATRPEELLEKAVSVYSHQINHERIKAEAEAFQAMHADLVQNYLGQYVAICKGQLVDHDPDFQSLHSRIRKRFGRQPVLLRLVENKPERTLLFRSPRIEQGQP